VVKNEKRSGRTRLLGLFLAKDATWRFRADLQPGGRDGDAAVGAQAVSPGLDARQRRGDGREFGGLALTLRESISRSVATWARESCGWPKWSAAASARLTVPPRCAEICASRAVRMSSNACWKLALCCLSMGESFLFTSSCAAMRRRRLTKVKPMPCIVQGTIICIFLTPTEIP
jgi:hypothetical protein